jgi:catechol 2,3-dioxygenase-like lactoylglutathione lyase family enzyme
MKLEVVVMPVSDVDRAKCFYQMLGWRLDADFTRHLAIEYPKQGIRFNAIAPASWTRLCMTLSTRFCTWHKRAK